jgi:hypothetical protein
MSVIDRSVYVQLDSILFSLVYLLSDARCLRHRIPEPDRQWQSTHQKKTSAIPNPHLNPRSASLQTTTKDLE